MSKKEYDRYKTAGDMASELRQVLQDASVSVATVARLQDAQPTSESSAFTTTSAVRRARDAERRQLTVMICNCDASDPEESIASLDPEDQHDLLGAFQHLCEVVTKRFDGTIARSTGQELLVCFGFPTAYEDAPQRAIRTGLGIMDEMKHLNDDLQKQKKVQLSAWAAIHTGMAVAGDSGVDTLSIIGDARNVASRLESLTEPEQIIISDATHRLVKGYFVFESQGKHKIRGISQPIELFQVLEETTAGSRVELVDPANLTPLAELSCPFPSARRA